jgi:hypothetical protein
MDYTPAAEYSALRLRALRAGTGVEFAATGTRGLLVEIGYSEAVLTLVALEDGSASLYFSNGGKVISAGQQDPKAVAARSLVSFAAHMLPHLTRTASYPLPLPAHTRFYFIAPDGIHTAEASEEDLANNRHTLSALFHTAHELMLEMREAAEKADIVK